MYCYRCMNPIPDNGYCPYCRRSADIEAEAHHLKPGTVLNGKYLVGRALGEGGFGITYIGRDLTLDIKVAVKEYYPCGYVSRNHHVNNMIAAISDKQLPVFQKGRERFLQEARSLAKFSNEKGVVFVRDYFESCGSAYIVMEYLEGITLKEYLDRNKTFDAKTIFELMLPISASLEKIHSAGIIHRDISPDNIMYLSDGSLKLMDFGSARDYAGADKELSVMIKQGYAPEEQYRRNGAQGPWTDVYGLCATIYKCITGVVPEDSLNRLHSDTLKKPSELGADISGRLEKVLMNGLAVYQKDRIRDMNQFRKLVTDALEQRAPEYAPVYGGNDRGEDIYMTCIVDEPPRTDLTQAADRSAGQPQYINRPQTVNTQVTYPAQTTYPTQITGQTQITNQAPYMNSAYGQTDTQKTYGDPYYRNTDFNTTGDRQPSSQHPTPPPKKSAAPIVIAIIVALLVIAAVGGLIYWLINSDRDESGSKSSEEQSDTAESDTADVSSATEATVEPTQKATSEPTEETTQIVTVKVPDVVGLSASEAIEELNEAGLTATWETVPDSDHDKDEVISQHPAADTEVEPGSEVVIYISEGPEEVYLYCCNESITVRERATRYSDGIDTVALGERVVYLDTVYDFYHIRHNGKEGYVLKKYFSDDPDAEYVEYQAFPKGTALFSRADGQLHLRATPSADGQILRSISPHEHVTLIQIRAEEVDGLWYDRILYDNVEGYVPDDYLTDDFEAELRSDVPGM